MLKLVITITYGYLGLVEKRNREKELFKKYEI